MQSTFSTQRKLHPSLPILSLNTDGYCTACYCTRKHIEKEEPANKLTKMEKKSHNH